MSEITGLRKKYMRNILSTEKTKVIYFIQDFSIYLITCKMQNIKNYMFMEKIST